MLTLEIFFLAGSKSEFHKTAGLIGTETLPGESRLRSETIPKQPNSNRACAHLWSGVSPVASTKSASAAIYNAMLVQVLAKRLRWAVAGRQPGHWIGHLVRPSFYPEPKQCPAG